MKIEINEQSKQAEVKYPCLMQRNNINARNQIVFFECESIGMVVASEEPTQPIGHHREDWLMNTFHPFKGSITLSND